MTLEKKIGRGLRNFALFAGIFLAIVYCISAGQIYAKKEYDWITQASLITSARFDDIISQSLMVNNMLLSDQDTLTAINNLSKMSDYSPNYYARYFDESYATIRASLNNYFTMRQFYRAIFFNENGDIIDGNSVVKDPVDTSLDYKLIPGVPGLLPGDYTIVPCHIDEWGKNHNQSVLSVIKRLVGNGMGYIEVQWTESNLDNQLQPSDNIYDIFLYDEAGTLLYSSNKENEIDYFEIINQKSPDTNYFSTSSEVVAFDKSQTTGVTTVIINHTSLYSRLIIQIVPWLFLLMSTFFVISLVYSKRASKMLIKPINTLRDVMERTTLQNMMEVTPETEMHLHSSEEISALYHSFFSVIKRLDYSIKSEKQLSVLQLQAQFDLLQAQVNPHFLYNVLNVISAKSIMGSTEYESICDMCSCLGKMLRYSTNTRKNLGSIREEKDYLQLYFNLLKYRYENRLEYEIVIESNIEDEPLPKIVLQQIVENCITHGYSNTRDSIQITVTGKGTPGCWVLNVHDNGTGFAEEAKQKLASQMEDIRQRLSDERNRVELEIGGMGLISTFARLYLIYGDSLSFLIQSDDIGTDVSISINLNQD
ncbi:MAG: sensor histidine kinase [Suipraeoptans sp.]